MDRVLAVRHQDALLDRGAGQLIAPHRQAELEPELDQVLATGPRCSGPPRRPRRRATPRDGSAGGRAPAGDSTSPAARAARAATQSATPDSGDSPPGDGPRRIAAETVGDQPFAPWRRIVAADVILGRAIVRVTSGIVIVSSSSSSISPGSERRRIAASPGMCRYECGRTGAVPPPPYLGASLLHCTIQRQSAGGASSGSGTGLRSMSLPRLTIRSRSPSAPPWYRSTNICGAMTAPSGRASAAALITASERRSAIRSR